MPAPFFLDYVTPQKQAFSPHLFASVRFFFHFRCGAESERTGRPPLKEQMHNDVQ